MNEGNRQMVNWTYLAGWDPSAGLKKTQTRRECEVVTLKNKALLSVMLAVLMVAGLLTLVEPANAAFPGENGRIAFSSNRSGNYEIYTMRANGTKVKLVPGASHPADDREPAYSPDGSKIAFRSDRSNPGSGIYDIYVVNLTGTPKLTQVTNDPADDRDPNWSPDGSRIAFSSTRSGNLDIWSVSSTGTEEDPVNHTSRLINPSRLPPVNELRPVYSPDGSWIAFQSDYFGDWDIWSVSSTNPLAFATITILSSKDEEPAYSPDGSRIAFSSDRGGNFNVDIYTVSSSGTEVDLKQITNYPAAHIAEKPAYSPDGKRIVFDDNRSDPFNDNYEIYTVSSTGTEVDLKQVTNHSEIDYAADWQAKED